MHSGPASTGWGRLLVPLAAALLLTGACGVRTSDSTDTAAPVAESGYEPSLEASPDIAPDPAVGEPTPESAPEAASESASAPATESSQPGTPTSGKAAGSAPRSASAPAPGPSTKGGGGEKQPEGRSAASPSPSAGSTGGAKVAPAPAPAPGGDPVPAAPASCTGREAPIVIGSVSTKSGVVGEAFRGGTEAVQAWAAATNAKGGINCHRVKFTVGDDGGDPNRHQALVQQMVESDKVIAFVQQMAPISGFASVDYINQKKVPVIGNEGGSPWFHQSPYFFPVGLSGGVQWSEAFFASPLVSGVAKGAKKAAAISCVEAPACSSLKDNAEVAAKKFGLDVVYNAGASLTQPDYTSHCLGAQSAGAEIFAISLDGNSVHRVARSCAAVGYHPTYSAVATILNVDFQSNPDMNGFVGTTWTRTWFDTSNPEIKQFHTALNRYVKGFVPNAGGSLGWSAAKVFEHAARNVGDTPTSAAILDGLWSIKDNEFGGLTAPLTFTREQPTKPKLCFWSPVVRDGKWRDGAKRSCP